MSTSLISSLNFGISNNLNFTSIGLSFSSFSASSFTSFAIAFPVPLFAFGVAIVAFSPATSSNDFFSATTPVVVSFNSLLAFCKLLEKALTQVEDSNTLANLLAAVPKSKFKAASKDSFSMPKID